MKVSATMDLEKLAEKMGQLTGLDMSGFAGLKNAQVMRDTTLVERFEGSDMDDISESAWQEMLSLQDIWF